MGISIQVEDAHETEPLQGSIGSDRDVTTFGLTIDAFAPATDAGVDIAAGANPGPGGDRPLRTGGRGHSGEAEPLTGGAVVTPPARGLPEPCGGPG